MIKNKKLLAALTFPIVFLALWTGWLQYQRRAVVRRVTVSTDGYDPRDLLSGHYVNLRPDWQQTDCTQFDGNVCPEKDFKRFYIYYLPEQDAPLLEKLMRKQNNRPKTDLVFIYSPGKEPVPENLLIDGEDWQTGLQRYKALNNQINGGK